MFYTYCIVLLISIGIKFYVSRRLALSQPSPVRRIVILLLLVAYAQSLLEMYGLYAAQDPASFDLSLLLKAYYVLISFYLGLLPAIVLAVIQYRVRYLLVYAGLLCAGGMSAAIAMTDSIIAGAIPLSNSITRIPGPYYIAFIVYLLVCCLCVIAIPRYCYAKSNDEIMRVKSANLLAGSILGVLAALAVVGLMQAGAQLNAMGIMPLLLALFLLVIGECLQPEAVYDFRCHIPFTRKYNIIQQLTHELRYLTKEVHATGSRDKAKEIQYILALQASELYPRQIDAAASLKISEASFSRHLATAKQRYKQPTAAKPARKSFLKL